MQDDVLLPDLTVAETLRYAADLRLPLSIDAAERHTISQDVIRELGLTDCMSTKIGNKTRKGCSGGEKGRTSLGVRLLCNPSVLFLDEVTTGLDAQSAFRLVKTLKELAASGRTVIVTIHQPRSEIWALFDRLVVLSQGNLIYSGLASKSIQHFEKLGHTMPEYSNPAEYLIDLISSDDRQPDHEDSCHQRVRRLLGAWRDNVQQEQINEKTEEDNTVLVPSSSSEYFHSPKPEFWSSVKTQVARTIKVELRSPFGMSASLSESIVLGIVGGWIFLNLDESLSGIRSREGALYCAAVLQGYLVLLQETYRLSFDVVLFDRERTEGVVGVLSFLVSRRLAKAVLEDLLVPLIFSVIFYFLAGFRPVATQFFCFYAVILLCQFISVCFATVCVAAFRDFARASLIANLSFTLQSICSK